MSAIGRRVSVGRRPAHQYRGRQVCADTALHERAIEHVLRYAPPGSLVADLGCGQGAFALRMADAGLDVVGIDLLPAGEQVSEEFRYQELDLFDAAARERFLDQHRSTFDAVVLLEVIEHVHDPWETLRFARAPAQGRRPAALDAEHHELLFAIPVPDRGTLPPVRAARSRIWAHQPNDRADGPETVLAETGLALMHKAPGSAMPVLVSDTAIRSIGHRLFHAGHGSWPPRSRR